MFARVIEVAGEKMFELCKHELVPIHNVLSSEEKSRLLKKYGIRIGQLPKILESDPALSALKSAGVKVGDIIEITRESETAGKTAYYRVVRRG